jgi:formylglycine-generating enzyme required for sulfatase activity
MLLAKQPGQPQSGQARSALAHVAENKRLILLGDPGSGKSTFLRFLALRLAQACLQPDGDWLRYLSWPIYPTEQERASFRRTEEEEEILGEASWPYPPFVPVSVTLRDFAATDFEPTSPLALWEFIAADLTYRGLADSRQALYNQLVEGRAIFLLDGVDEVPTQRRPQVWQAIGALKRGVFNRCHWLATCRILSYVEQEAASAGATGKATLAPLTETQIKTFITAWYRALVESGEKSPAQGDSLAAQLQRAATGPLQELAQNPMLLTIMALVQTYHGALPDERAKLYQACVQTLLLRWQQSKETAATGLPRSLAELGLKQEVIEPLLWEIGWVAHAEQSRQQGVADISEEQVMALAKKHLGDYAKAEAFVEYTERRAHLLLGRGGVEGRRFSFPHRTFQEYLAGRHLANKRRFGHEAIDLARAGAPWREVLLLAAGSLVYNQQVVQNLLDALEDLLPKTQPAPGDTAGWQQLWRAGEMLAIAGVAAAEADEVGRELLPRARTYLAALLDGGELSPPERAEAGRALAALDDPRPGVELAANGLPDIAWRPVEAGEFIMGANDAGEDAQPQHRLFLTAFEMSQYPVTNAQFSAFVDAGGYRTEAYWPEAKKAGYWQEGQFKGRFDDEPRAEPYNFGSPYNLPNHPVVGVSWFEAVAFCHWLTEKLGCPVRLPTEAEWEKAARGVDGRKYPWGSQEEAAGRCNIAETGINTTSAVGLFPSGASPYGVFDLSGNVWEWCSTIWAEKAYPFKVQDEWRRDYLNRTNVHRVLRGGAFSNEANYARAAVRDWDDPNDRSRNVGFRLVRPPNF